MRREDSKTKRNEQFDCMYLLYCLKNTEKSGFWSSQSIISFKLQLQTSSEIYKQYFHENTNHICSLHTCFYYTCFYCECHISRHFPCIILTVPKMKLNLTRTFNGWTAFTKEAFLSNGTVYTVQTYRAVWFNLISLS